MKKIGMAMGVGVSNFRSKIIEVKCSLTPGHGDVSLVDGEIGKDALDALLECVSFLSKEMKINFSKLGLKLTIAEVMDGQSLGLALALAIYSAVKKIPISQEVVITGALDLVGNVSVVDAIREKFLAVIRLEQIKAFMFPLQNSPDMTAASYFKRCQCEQNMTNDGNISLVSMKADADIKLKLMPVVDFKNALQELTNFD